MTRLRREKEFNPTRLLFADLHLDERKSFEIFYGSRLEDGLNVLDQIIEAGKYLQIIFLGDITERKDKHSSEVVNQFLNRIKDFSESQGEDRDINLILLKGNHDFHISPYFNMLNHYNGVKFISEYDDSYINFFPYGTKTIIIDSQANFSCLFFHGSVNGATYDNGQKVIVKDDEMNFENIDKPYLIFGGHIHKPQEIETRKHKIIYVGAPYQTEFGQSYDGGYILFDANSRLWERRYLKAPKFIDLDIKAKDILAEDVSLNLENLSEQVKGNYIRLPWQLTKKERIKLNIKVVRENLIKLGAKGMSFEPKICSDNKEERAIEINETFSPNEILAEVVKEQKELNEKEMLSYGVNLYQQVKEN